MRIDCQRLGGETVPSRLHDGSSASELQVRIVLRMYEVRDGNELVSLKRKN